MIFAPLLPFATLREILPATLREMTARPKWVDIPQVLTQQYAF
jgi:hypothetical protein